ncbi:hypothetical protein [Paralysiella testudinis]|uniref:Uncharacterized protein n=1 Tax=Paralysiella testudinis TaxID=2809020 RepID=A0A892ZM11_9NEIS|nr:hypothetical protein [Paralysiella testudinis]QRQ82827.1 hypothetical protein JQU52_05445 [Paralysiella testudinis]
MVMIANWTRIAIRPKIIAAHINKHEAMPSPTVLNYITIGATVIATTLSILSIFAVLLERRRAITPALNHIL